MGWFCKEKDSEEYVEAGAIKITETDDNLYVAEYSDSGEMVNKPIIDKYKEQVEYYRTRINDLENKVDKHKIALEKCTQHEAELVERIDELTKQLNEVNNTKSRVVSRDEALDLYDRGKCVVGLIDACGKPKDPWVTTTKIPNVDYSRWEAKSFSKLTGGEMYSSYVTFVCIEGGN